ncbi:DUF3558 family protein [Nocardia ninae]|nr:DUF3558 family protein [Nocardia ninae]
MTRNMFRPQSRVSVSVVMLTALAGAAATGCSGDNHSVPPADFTSTAASAASSTTAADWYKPPAAFEGLDPCSIITPAEASALAGRPDLRAARNEGLRPDMSIVGKYDICSWMVGETSPVGVSLQIRDEVLGEVEQGQDAASLWMAEQLGRPANLSHGKNPADLGVEDCAAYVGYSERRAAGVLLTLPTTPATQIPTDTDNLCSRNQTILRDILARVPWK